MKPVVSVVLPVFNAEKFLDETLVSILQQTYDNFELLIINDGSTDKSLEIIKKYEDDRIRIINNGGVGATEAYNTGFKKAEGKYIAISDHDDLSEKRRFEQQVGFLETHSSVDITGCNYNVINEGGSFLFSVTQPETNSEIKEHLIRRGDSVFNPSLMIRRKVFENYGYYDRQFFPVSDFEYFLRNSDNLSFYNIQEVLYNWRTLSDSVSHKKVKLFNKQLFLVSEKYIRLKYIDHDKKSYFEITAIRAYYSDFLMKACKYCLLAFFSGRVNRQLIRIFVNSSLLSVFVKVMRKLWLVENPLFLHMKQKYKKLVL